MSQDYLIDKLENDQCPTPGCDGQNFEVNYVNKLGYLSGEVIIFECEDCGCEFEVEYKPVAVTILYHADPIAK